MRTLLRLTSGFLVLSSLLAFTFKAQTVKIQTTAICEMCKERIESSLGELDGVLDVRLDLTTKKVKIKFDDSKQSTASLRAAIANIGYAADDVLADRAAFEALPGCCQNPNSCSADERQR